MPISTPRLLSLLSVDVALPPWLRGLDQLRSSSVIQRAPTTLRLFNWSRLCTLPAFAHLLDGCASRLQRICPSREGTSTSPHSRRRSPTKSRASPSFRLFIAQHQH
ncbi:hypothetical protein GY45DRAFT_487881 [Cubamyces sp. BRFM 1775]|nr:hypothetical protein GY45DRAFT_487881 [Cubamyces sp. BRFM 1775]